MPLEVYFQDDIERIIAGLTTMAVESCVRGNVRRDEYARGMLTMARSMAISFGCDWNLILSRLSKGKDGWILSEAKTELLTE